MTPEEAYPKLTPVIKSLRVDNPDASDEDIHQVMGQFVKAGVDAHVEMGHDHATALRMTADKFGISEAPESHPVWGALQKYMDWASNPKQVGKDVLDTARTIASPTDSLIGRLVDKATGVPAYEKAREFGKMNVESGLNIMRSGNRDNTGSYEDLSTKKADRPFATGDAASIPADASGGFDRLPLNAADLVGQFAGAEPDTRVSPAVHGMEQVIMGAGMLRGMQGPHGVPEAPYRRPASENMPQPPVEPPVAPEIIKRQLSVGEQPVDFRPARNNLSEFGDRGTMHGPEGQASWEGLSPGDKAELRGTTVKGDLERQRMQLAAQEADAAQKPLDELLPTKPSSPLSRILQKEAPASHPLIDAINGAKNEWQLKQVLDKNEPILRDAAQNNPALAGQLREAISQHESQFVPSKSGKYGPASRSHAPEMVDALKNEPNTFRRLQMHQDMGVFNVSEDTSEMNRYGSGLKDDTTGNDRTAVLPAKQLPSAEAPAKTPRDLTVEGTSIERGPRPEIPDVPEGEPYSLTGEPESPAQREARRMREAMSAEHLSRTGELPGEQPGSVLDRIRRRINEHEYEVRKRVAAQKQYSGNPLKRLLAGEERGATNLPGRDVPEEKSLSKFEPTDPELRKEVQDNPQAVSGGNGLTEFVGPDWRVAKQTREVIPGNELSRKQQVSRLVNHFDRLSPKDLAVNQEALGVSDRGFIHHVDGADPSEVTRTADSTRSFQRIAAPDISNMNMPSGKDVATPGSEFNPKIAADKEGTPYKYDVAERRLRQEIDRRVPSKVSTLAEAKAVLAKENVTIVRRAATDEYRVNAKGGNEDSAYYTSDLQDAVNTGLQTNKRETIGPKDVIKKSWFADEGGSYEQNPRTAIQRIKEGPVAAKLKADAATVKDYIGKITSMPEKVVDAFVFARKTPADVLAEIRGLRGKSENFVIDTMRQIRKGQMPNGWQPDAARATLKSFQNDMFDHWASNIDSINKKYSLKGDNRRVTLSDGGYGPLDGKEVSPDFKKHLDAYQNFVKQSNEFASAMGRISSGRKFVQVGLRVKAIPKQILEQTVVQHLADNSMLHPGNFKKYYLPAIKDMIQDFRNEDNPMVHRARGVGAYGSIHEAEMGPALVDKLETAMQRAQGGNAQGFLSDLGDMKELYGKAFDFSDNLSKLATFRKAVDGQIAPDYWFMRDENGKLAFNPKANVKRPMSDAEASAYVNDHFVNFNEKSSALRAMTDNRTGANLVFDPYLTSKMKMMGVYANALKRNPLRTIATMTALAKIAKSSYDAGKGNMVRYHQFPDVVTANAGNDTHVDLNNFLSGTELLQGFKPFVENPSGSKAGNTLKGLFLAGTNFAMTGPYSIYSKYQQREDPGQDPVDNLKEQAAQFFMPMQTLKKDVNKMGGARAVLKYTTGVNTYKADTNELIAKSKNDDATMRDLNSALGRTSSLYYKDLSDGMSDTDAMRRANKRIKILTGKEMDFAKYLSSTNSP